MSVDLSSLRGSLVVTLHRYTIGLQHLIALNTRGSERVKAQSASRSARKLSYLDRDGRVGPSVLLIYKWKVLCTEQIFNE